jgi:catechol 2,3-dioxygenase-like lactoylglutathione lyase family enzyme
MLKVAHPILGVTSSAKAEQFYCGKLGFRVKHVYRPDPKQDDPCWMVVIRDRVPIVLSSFQGDGPPGRGLQIYVDDVRELRDELERAGVPSLGEILDQDWGNLELGVTDQDGNHLCFAQDKESVSDR